ncbi:hypothetical protein EVAR_101924_1 [Eumeta japonica]|uniref:Uncharacterized protein n=1 Tax=Eumeta variegata TaxID=151549 RepID=A0A4C1TSH6_EUMVA|nr:hypothetical protein EVAR_101924_1 [Eumeta japonica]
MDYTEHAEIRYFYGVARGNGHIAARLYREAIRQRGGAQPVLFPDHRVFINTHIAHLEGRILYSMPGTMIREGIPRADPDRVDIVLDKIERISSIST